LLKNSLECGGLTPLLVGDSQDTGKSESGVKPPHSKAWLEDKAQLLYLPLALLLSSLHGRLLNSHSCAKFHPIKSKHSGAITNANYRS
jgi:hypothetical protein